MKLHPVTAWLAGVIAALCFVSPASGQEVEEAPVAPPRYVRLKYRVTTDRVTTTEVERQGTPLVPHTETEVTVTLGPRLFDIAAEDGRRSLFDYESGWGHVIDPASETYRSVPLLAHFGFLEIEMFNRRKLGGVLAAADVDDPVFAPVELSILFGWPDPRDDADIESKTVDGLTVWSLADDELTRFVPFEHVLEAAQSAALDRFLHRRCHLHWEVREEIVAKARAPAELRYRWHNTGVRATAAWTLVSCDISDTAPTGIEGLTRDFPDTGLGRLARRVLQPGEDAPERLSHEDLVKLSNAARDAGRPSDAALLLLESNLQSGTSATAELRALLADADAAKSIRALLGSVALANSEPEKGVAELDAVDRSTLTHPAILDTFRANRLANMGRTNDATAAFVAALEALPYLSAAYKDLGMALHRAFRTDDAWLAWEIGRSVGPKHPTWQGVQGLEEHLRDTYGELL